MIVRAPDRFGLAQLHQCAGGWDGEARSPTACSSRAAETGSAQARLEALLETNDGFELAEKDLEIRGEGQVMGRARRACPTSSSPARRTTARPAAGAGAGGRDPRRRSRAHEPGERAAQGRRGGGFRARARLAAQGLNRAPRTASARVYSDASRETPDSSPRTQHRLRRLRGHGRGTQALSEAQISLGGAVNRNVREFQALHADAVPVIDPADVDRDSVRRLILVDTVHANRLGDLGDLCGRAEVQVVAFDHHAHPGDLPEYLDPERAGELQRRLAGHAPRAHHRRARHPRDAVRGHGVRARHPRGHRLAHLRHHDDSRRRGAGVLHARRRRHRAPGEVADQRAHAGAARHARPRRSGRPSSCRSPRRTVLLSALHENLYVEGVSVVAHRVMDLTGCDAYFLLGGDGGPHLRHGAEPRRTGGRRRRPARRRRRRAHGRGLRRREGPPLEDVAPRRSRGRPGRRRADQGRARRARGRPAHASRHGAGGRGRPAVPARGLGGVGVLARRRPRRPCRARRSRPRLRPRAGSRPVKAVMTGRVPLVWAETPWSGWRCASPRTRWAGCPWWPPAPPRT